MKTRFQFVVALTASLWTASLSLAQTPLETAIAYQGYLTNNGAPIVGPTNQLMTFRLFDVPLGGTALSTLSNIPVTIEDSLFTVPLNFATNLWDGNDRWIEVQIGTQVLVPRQKLRPVPYALYALNATPGTCAPWDCSGADVFNTNTGGVGVGTSAPERKLHVFAGSAGTVTANSGADLVVEDDSSTYINLLSPTTLDSAVLFGTPTNAADGGVLYNIAGDRSMYFRTGGNTTRAIISATGNFGIGTTTPAQKLDVAGTIEMDGFKLPTGAAATRVLTSDASGVGTWQPAGTNPWTVTPPNLSYSAGSVGIGTSAPQNTLHVAGDGDVLALEGANTVFLELFPDGFAAGRKGWFGFGNTSNDNLTIQNQIVGANINLLPTSGNVGIGTTSPAASLHVNGNGRFQNSLTVYSADTINSQFSFHSSSPFIHGLGANLRLYNGTHESARLSGGTTDFFGAEGSGAALSLYSDDGTTETVQLLGDDGDGGSSLILRNAANEYAFVMDADDTGGGAAMTLRDANGSPSILLDSTESGGGAVISLNNGTGERTIKFDADASSGASVIRMYQAGSSSPVIELDASHNGSGRITTEVLEITGADLSEKFPTSEVIAEGMVVAIDAENEGKLCLARGAYNRAVAGVVSGANNFAVGAILGNRDESAGGPPIALAGRVYVWVDADAAPVKAGDLLTTSDTPGHAMKVQDYAAAQGAILGKAMTSLNSGKGLVLVLVNLQ